VATGAATGMASPTICSAFAAVPAGAHSTTWNACHQRFNDWLSGFRGVASRYLPNYLGWRWARDGSPVSSAEQLLSTAIGAINR